MEKRGPYHREEREFAHILVPKLGRIVKTSECLVDEDKWIFGKSGSLLRLEVPYQNISEPYFMVASLVHEAGHYYGERERTLRWKTMLKFLVLMLANCFDIPEENRDAGQYLTAHLKRFIKAGQDSVENLGYLALLKKRAEEAVIRLLNDERTLEKLRELSRLDAIEGHDGDAFCEMANCLLSQNFPFELAGPSVLHNEIELTSYLLKECYADAMMLYTLNLSFSQYLRIHLNSSEFDFESTNDQLKARLQQRIHLVKAAMCESEIWDKTKCDEVLKTFPQEIESNHRMPDFAQKTWLTCLESLNIGRAPLWFHPSILELLTDYLSKCLSITKSTCDNDNELQKMRNDLCYQFRTVVLQDRLLGDKFREFIYASRKEMLDRLDMV